ncbi:LSm family protein [Ignisphaera sp. 4213-co]|uniref:Putative snRNP Sm-like protein n=1 Tax=Ignisphaera cupida TaxID=3050454 RepID=A0ABD4Z3D9_9CREN|nr:LSm family protein [Ignisphaera sp. 4213-co]MDK6027832.1 LSm family protein [Ignisphaera sp. 4213-co]
MSSQQVDTAHKILAESLGQLVLIKLRGGKSIRGRLRSYDLHLNIVLDDAEEEHGDGNWRKLGTVLIRGENIVVISPM